ncbi:MAG: ABC transporter permease, partial [Acidimicrobiales bacterium]
MRTILRATMRASARRLAGTGLAVCLAVAFLAGTLLLSDTLRANFDRLFATALGRADVVVRQAGALDTDVEAVQGLVDASLAGVLSEVDGVRAVEPRIEGFGQLSGADGEKLGGEGPPTLAGSWVTDPDLNPYELAEGRAPAAADEVVINRGAAEDGDLAVGDVTTVATPEPLRVRIVGIATFGGEDGLGPTTFAGFSLAGAEQHVTGRPGQATSLLVAAEDGADADEVRSRVAAMLPDGAEAITGADLAAEASDAIDADFLGFLRGFLLAFALVALLVAAFSIHNTFAIVVAQRSREAALLRAVGAERRQVLAATAGEAALVGLAASALGLVAGIGLAGLLKGVFDAFGFALPAGGLDLRPSTLVLAPIVGIAVSVLAAAGPAVRASKVAPLAALRGAELDRTGASPARAVAGAVLAVAG